jgi:hypothetical protein
VITWESIGVRKRRPVELAWGQALEISIGKGDDPFHFTERRAYCKALRDAITGLEIARVTLAKATQRNARGGMWG